MHEGYCEHLKAMNTYLLTKPIGYNMSNNKKIGYFNIEEFIKIKERITDGGRTNQ